MINNETLVNSNSTTPERTNDTCCPSADQKSITSATYQPTSSTPSTTRSSNTSTPTHSLNWNGISDHSSSMYHHLALQQQQHYSLMLNLYHNNLFERLVLPTAAAAASATALAFRSSAIGYGSRKFSSHGATKRHQQSFASSKVTDTGKFKPDAARPLLIGHQGELNNKDQVNGKKRRRKRPRRRRKRKKKRPEKLKVDLMADGMQKQATASSSVDTHLLATK